VNFSFFFPCGEEMSPSFLVTFLCLYPPLLLYTVVDTLFPSSGIPEAVVFPKPPRARPTSFLPIDQVGFVFVLFIIRGFFRMDAVEVPVVHLGLMKPFCYEDSQFALLPPRDAPLLKSNPLISAPFFLGSTSLLRKRSHAPSLSCSTIPPSPTVRFLPLFLTRNPGTPLPLAYPAVRLPLSPPKISL